MFRSNELKWNNAIIGDLDVNIADLSEGGQVIVYRDPDIKTINVRSSFWVSSFDKAQGVPHLMEHCLFSKVLDGESLFNVMDKLNQLGISLNAFTSEKDMILQAYTDMCMRKEDYPNDKIYSEMADKFSYKKLLSKVGELHFNLVNEEVSEEYVEKEKNVIYGEIQARYVGDAQNIRKIAEHNACSGNKYSSIGTRWHVQSTNTDMINYMRKRVFSPNNIKYIHISAPDHVPLEDIGMLYLDKLFLGLEANKIKVIQMDPKEKDKDHVKFVEEYCMKRYKPDIRSYQIRSISANDQLKKESAYIHKSKSIKKTATIKDVIITLPTFKYSLEYLINNDVNSMVVNYLADKFDTYYREIHPCTYGVHVRRSIWRHKKNYTSVSFYIKLAEKESTSEFIKTLEDFKKYVLDDSFIEEHIDSRVNALKNSWYSFTERDYDWSSLEYSHIILATILVGSTGESAETKAEYLRKFKAEEGRLFPDEYIKLLDYIQNSKDIMKDLLSKYIDKWKVSVFDSENVYEQDQDKSKKKFIKKK